MPDSVFHAENNPFRKLDANRFPSDVKEGAARAVVARRPKAKIKKGGAPHAGHAEKTPDVAREADDAELFLNAIGRVSSLPAHGREVAAKPLSVAAVPPDAPAAAELQRLVEGGLEFALSLTDEYLEGHVIGLDMAAVNKLRAGALSPEAHIDLHGLNAAQAFEALRWFMRGCWYKSMRTVLVVPGRGRNSPNGMGVLREKLPHWLTQDPFKRVVLAFCTARSHDGGLGGIYVLLRKYRKKGRVCWEKMPADADLC
ncbi:MAG: Smr/MutS family protein [Desulfovibrio sp.]|jgi:DNA-nicking Smr family endonuclease|nr:Smr/MutS family protein [Desulfovibrio sp.]